jgi:hypothetical protein
MVTTNKKRMAEVVTHGRAVREEDPSFNVWNNKAV